MARTPEQWAQLASYVHEDCTSELCPDLANLAMRFASAMAEAEQRGRERGIEEVALEFDRFGWVGAADLARDMAGWSEERRREATEAAERARALYENAASLRDALEDLISECAAGSCNGSDEACGVCASIRVARTLLMQQRLGMAEAEMPRGAPGSGGLHQHRLLKPEDADVVPRPPDSSPIDMLLHCPACGLQHVDAPEPGTDWNNPPHKSHKCHRCGKVWRPADVPTNGVAAVKTRGKADTWPELRPHPPVGAPGEDPAKCDHAWEPHLWEPDSEYCPYCRSLRPPRK